MDTIVEPREVPFFRYPHVFTQHQAGLEDVLRRVVASGAYILQKELRDFEMHLATYLDAKHALGVGNCTDGLQLAIMAAGIGPGDEVIFSSHTFVATAAAIHFAGAKPVPVECGPDHLIDADAVAAAITPRTRAVMPTQLNGRTCDMDALGALVDRHDLLLIEDAAQSLGARYKGKAAGTFGLASAFSFYPAKNLGAFGDAGAVVTSDEVVFEQVMLLRDHGRNHDGEVVRWGMNSRLDNVQAAILDFKLDRYEEEITRRREIANSYQEGLSEVSELVLPPAPGSDPDRFDVFQNYEIEAERRDELQMFLKSRGVGTLIQWGGKAVHQFEGLGLDFHLPYTERLFTRALLLPMNTSLSDDDVAYVVDMIREFYGYRQA